MDSASDIETMRGMSYGDFKKFTPLQDGARALVIKVYDGDSLTVSWKDPSGVYVRSASRLFGIDTPELRGSSPYEKSLALEAKERLAGVAMGEMVTVFDVSSEKYGRILCDLATDTIPSIAQYMLEEPRLCRKYDGGKKTSWIEIVDVDSE